MKKTVRAKIPRCFASLQHELGDSATYNNYYFGSGGMSLRITREDLARFGLTDDTFWAHERILKDLRKAISDIRREGFGVQIRDAWRPRKLYDLIVEKMDRHGTNPDRKNLINRKTKPHSTGLAIDAVLTDDKGSLIWTRNQGVDGIASCRYGFYASNTDEKSMTYQGLQDILVGGFLRSGFRLGSKKEYWHFEHLSIVGARRW